jgi:opacity protein-like surface antigen
MKQSFGLLVLAGVVMVSSVSFAGDDQIGIYVAPKFVYGLTQTNNTKLHETSYDNATYDPDHSYIFNIGNKTDSSFGGSLAIGYDFEKKFGVPIRTEIEYAITSDVDAKRSFTFLDNNGQDMDTDNWKQSFGIQTLLVNSYWDINTGTNFTPYVGAGIGLGIIKTDFSGSGWNPGYSNWDDPNLGSKTVTNFAWNAGAGIGYDLTDNWTVDLGYKFVDVGSVKTSVHIKPSSGNPDRRTEIYSKTDNLYQHQTSLGVRYTF